MPPIGCKVGFNVGGKQTVTLSQYKTLVLLVVLTAMATTLFCGAYMSRVWESDAGWFTYVSLLFFLGWACSPYVFFWIKSREAEFVGPFQLSYLVAAALVCGSGVAIVLDSAFVHPDPQAGLVFFVIPFYQWLIIGLATLFALFLSWRKRQ